MRVNVRKKAVAIPRLIVVALAGFILFGFGPCSPNFYPIIFVHGGSGSGSQFESQAMRFASNGYPRSYIEVLEYNSAVIDEILPDVHAGLDDLIAELQARTGKAKVDLLGHSLGTYVSHTYLATPERAANVAHYVNIDGASADAPPGGVPTLALWAGAVERQVPGEIVGATNVTIPNQEHVQVATSEESFFEMYHFFRGRAPHNTPIVPQPWPRISGRAVVFPDNVGLDGATLEVWHVDADTGERKCDNPVATFEIGPDGDFGPFWGVNGLRYEFVLLREGELTYHFFYEPFLRSDHLVRLNVPILLELFLERSENHAVVGVIRYKEFWGDRGPENDVLSINGTNVINPITAPSGEVGAASVAFIAGDVGSDGVTDLETIPFPLEIVPFLTGADLFIPTDPPGTVSVETVPRGDTSAARTVNVPNLPSTDHTITIQLHDFEQ